MGAVNCCSRALLPAPAGIGETSSREATKEEGMATSTPLQADALEFRPLEMDKEVSKKMCDMNFWHIAMERMMF